jgi:6-phosphogluconolactonase
MTPHLIRVEDAEAVARAAAEEVVASAARALAYRGRFTIALSGGSTPRGLYALLADARAPFRERIRWDRTHVFFGDERHVPPGHPESNFRMASEALLAHVAVASVHRILGELASAAAAAEAYETELRRFFALTAAEEPPPRLDLVLLGLGPDGHTASLFPGTDALDERRRWVTAPYVERQHGHRITLTFPVLDRAREVLFLVAGKEKAVALSKVLAPPAGEAPLPAARVRPAGESPLWIVDREAASLVREASGTDRMP